MPITPFHFGPGLAVKAAVPRGFSWTAFVASQVLIDCETLYYIVTNQYPLHREMHTFVGATAVGLIAGAILVGLVRAIPQIERWIEGWVPLLRSEIGTRALIVGGMAGGASHPLFDGIMHQDIRPFAPFTDSNPLLGVVGLGSLHLGCMVAGVIGIALLWIQAHREERVGVAGRKL